MVLYTVLPASAYRFIEFEVLNSILMFLVFVLLSISVFAYIERKYMDKAIALTLSIVPFSYGLINMIAVETNY